MAGLLDRKVAVITGGASGIGEATARKYIAEGASVLIADIQDERGERLAYELGERAKYCHVDVTIESEVEKSVSTAVSTFGRLDIYFNNAGMQGDPSKITELKSGGIESTLRLLTSSVLLGHKYAARQFITQGNGGCIISTASAAASEGGWSAVGYTAAKHSVLGIVRQAVAELARYKIRSNAISPGVILTPIMSASFGIPAEEATEFSNFLAEKLGSTQPSGRLGHAEDVANVATFLASDLSEYVNGAAIPVDGGATAVTLGSFESEIKLVVEEYRSNNKSSVEDPRITK